MKEGRKMLQKGRKDAYDRSDKRFSTSSASVTWMIFGRRLARCTSKHRRAILLHRMVKVASTPTLLGLLVCVGCMLVSTQSLPVLRHARHPPQSRSEELQRLIKNTLLEIGQTKDMAALRSNAHGQLDDSCNRSGVA